MREGGRERQSERATSNNRVRERGREREREIGREREKKVSSTHAEGLLQGFELNTAVGSLTCPASYANAISQSLGNTKLWLRKSA